MSYLKSAYLYFLAIQINLIKKIKKIYYTTQYYNNSLKSKTPQQIYFHPNPVLLSPLTTHKNFSFKISSIDTNMFWKEFSSIKDAENLNSFFWLNLIDRKNDGECYSKYLIFGYIKILNIKTNHMGQILSD